MHDPMVVAWEIKLPIPKHEKTPFRKGRRWGFTRRRFTNVEAAGRPMEPWWRPSAWMFAIAGRSYRWRRLATIWHVEPHGHDSGDVCKHYRRTQNDAGDWETKHLTRWKWHVHHWHIQIPLLQNTRARLFDKCALCGRKGQPNVSHQWDGKPVGWRKWRSREDLYHNECSGLLSLRGANNEHEIIHRRTLAALAFVWNMPVEDVPRRLFPGTDGYRGDRPGPGDFNLHYRLEKLLEKDAKEAART